MPKDLDKVRKSLEQSIKKKDKEAFINALAELTILIETPRYARREEAFKIEESAMRDASEAKFVQSADDMKELLAEVHNIATQQKITEETKKEIDKAIINNNVRKLAELWHEIPIEDHPGPSVPEVEDYLVAAITKAGIRDEVNAELRKIIDAEQKVEAKREERANRELKRKKEIEFRPSTRKELLEGISDLKLVAPAVIHSPGTCSACRRIIEGGEPFYIDSETGNVYHLSCAMRTFPERKWYY
jgi:hypothetical protein